MTIPKAPAGLSKASQTLWREVLEDFELSAAEEVVFHEALVALDRSRQAAEVVEREGVTVADRYGTPKAHPAVDVEARSRTIFARLVQQLGVKLAADTPGPRRGAKPGPRPSTARAR